MIVWQFLFLALLLPVCLIGPGFFFVSRLRWDPLEKLCGSIALSILLLYLTSFGIYLLNLHPACFYVVSAGCMVLLLFRIRELMGLARNQGLQPVFIAYGLLLAWLVGWLALTRHYSGGGWGADWHEHYGRVLFFLDHFDTGTLFTVDNFPVPARPPLMHLVCGHFMAQAGKDFAFFQVIVLCLNSLVFLPCCLIARTLASRAGWTYLLIAAFLALNPMLVQNATYAWPRLMSYFFVLLALGIYLRGWRQNDLLRMGAASAAMSAGVLAHYSAGPYALFLCLHYLVFVFRRREKRWRELGAMAVACTLVLATWFAWCVLVYGLHVTVAENTPAREVANLPYMEHLANMAGNVFSTIVPFPLRPAVHIDFVFNWVSKVGYLRDYMFFMYQMNLIVAMGSVGGLVVLYLLYKRLLSGWAFFRKPEPRFWFLFIVFCVTLGIILNGAYAWGSAEVCLQPVVLVGVTLLAASFRRLARPVRWAIVAGLAADFILGIVIQFAIESQVCQLIERVPGGAKLDVPDCMLGGSCVANWMTKTDAGFTFFGDYFASWQWLLWVVLSVMALFWLTVALRASVRPAEITPRAGPA